MQTTQEAFLTKATTGIAGAGVILPAWWPSLAESSNVAAQLVPIVSLVWLVLQIIRHLRGRKEKE